MNIYVLDCTLKSGGKSVSVVTAESEFGAYLELKIHGKRSAIQDEYQLIACQEVGYSNAQYRQIVSEGIAFGLPLVIENEIDINQNGVYTSAEGFNLVNVNVPQPLLEQCNVIPSNQSQTIFPSSNHLINKVNVLGDENLTPENIKKDISIFGVEGIHEEDWIIKRKKQGFSLDNIWYLTLSQLDSIDDVVQSSVESAAACLFCGLSVAGDIVHNVKSISNYGMYKTYKNSLIDSISFPYLTTIYGEYAMFEIARNTKIKNVNLSALTSITGTYSLGYAFHGNENLESVDMRNLQSIYGHRAMEYAFRYTNLSNIDMHNVEIIDGDYAMYNFCSYLLNLEKFDFSSLSTIRGKYAMYYAFSHSSLKSAVFNNLVVIAKSTYLGSEGNCSGLFQYAFAWSDIEEFSMPMLATITSITTNDTYVFAYCCYMCASLKTVSMPNLNTTSTTNENTNNFSYFCYGCTNLEYVDWGRVGVGSINTSTNQNVYVNAFTGCTKLTTFRIHPKGIRINGVGTNPLGTATNVTNLILSDVADTNIYTTWCPLSNESILHVLQQLSPSTTGLTCAFKYKTITIDDPLHDDILSAKNARTNWTISGLTIE